jgi:hypothetical protein
MWNLLFPVAILEAAVHPTHLSLGRRLRRDAWPYNLTFSVLPCAIFQEPFYRFSVIPETSDFRPSFPSFFYNYQGYLSCSGVNDLMFPSRLNYMLM